MRYANWIVATAAGASFGFMAAGGLAQVKSASRSDIEEEESAKSPPKLTERSSLLDKRKAAGGERRETRRVPTETAAPNTTISAAANANATFRSSQLIGTNITDGDGRAIGKIVDFVSDARGNIQYPIVSYSGAAGKLFAIPYSGLNFAAGANNTTTARLAFDPQILQNAPSFTSTTFPNFSDPAFSSEIKSFYSRLLDRRVAQDPTVPANGPGDRPQTQDQAGTPTREIDPTLPANGPGDKPATVDPALPRTGTQPAATSTDPHIPGTTGTENGGFPPTAASSNVGTGRSTGSGTPAGFAIPGGIVDGSTGSPLSGEARRGPQSSAGENGGPANNRLMLRSSQMVGMSIQGQDGKAMGKVVDFVGDNNGNNHYAVISMGDEDRNVVVPFKALNFHAGAKGSNFATLRLAPEQLKNAPSFLGNKWPNFMDSDVTNGVAKFYERFNYHNSDGLKYPVSVRPNSGTPANPKAGPVGSRPEVPRTGGPGPRIPAPGVGVPGVPGVPGLPGRGPGGAPGKVPGIPAPGGGAPGGGGAPRGGGGVRAAGS